MSTEEIKINVDNITELDTGRANSFGSIGIGEKTDDLRNLKDGNGEDNLLVGVLREKLNGAIGKLKNLKSSLGVANNIVGNESGWVDNRRHNTKRRGDDELDNSGRRDFLIKAGIIGAGVVSGIASPGELLLGESGRIEEERKRVAKRKVEMIKDGLHQEEQENIRIENAVALRKILGKQYLENGRVEINEEIVKEIRYYWIKEYKSGGRQHLGLMGALERMKPWHKEIKLIFEENLPGIPSDIVEDLIYLAIPESHFTIGSKSKAGAKGEYQMMANTARGEGGLVVDSRIDERLDTLANAKAASKTLFNYYRAAKNDANSLKDAWDLALAKFNGAYIKGYLRQYGELGGAVKYKTYLKYRQERLNNFFRQIEREGVLKRDLRFRESLSTIAKKYGVSKRDLKVVEEVSEKTGKSKKKVVIPISFRGGRISEKILDVIFDDYLSDSLENLNYPEKFYAVIEVLKKEDLMLNDKDDREQIIFQTIGEFKKSWRYWRKEELTKITLRDINKHFVAPGTEASLQRLEEANPHIKSSRANLADSKYDNVRIYFLSDDVLDTQFIEYPTLKGNSKTKV